MTTRLRALVHQWRDFFHEWQVTTLWYHGTRRSLAAFPSAQQRMQLSLWQRCCLTYRAWLRRKV